MLFNERGEVYEASGNYDQAIKDYDRAIGLDPSSALVFGNRCSVHYKKKEYEKALKDGLETH